jgi:Rrf2 family protein
MLRRSAVHALKALLELAQDPAQWRSVRDLAQAQGLPEPMLEQVVLRLRRAGLVVARRGRQGGYRLGAAAEAVSLAAVLAAVGARPQRSRQALPPPWTGQDDDLDGLDASEGARRAGDQVTQALDRRLQQAVQRELAALTLADLAHDLSSARAALSEEGGLLLG